MEVASQEKIQVREKDVQQDVQRTVDFVNNSFDPRESRKILNEEFLRGLVAGAMRDALTERTLARITAIARGETAPADDADSPAEEPADEIQTAAEPEGTSEPEATSEPETEIESPAAADAAPDQSAVEAE
jgi:hypothetical protein